MYVFEAVSDMELIDVMGEATRDESTAIAQRLAAVAELFVRRSGASADCEWWCADACDAVAAEVSAVQHIGHARASRRSKRSGSSTRRRPPVSVVTPSSPRRRKRLRPKAIRLVNAFRP
jgi:glutathione S-transferase